MKRILKESSQGLKNVMYFFSFNSSYFFSYDVNADHMTKSATMEHQVNWRVNHYLGFINRHIFNMRVFRRELLFNFCMRNFHHQAAVKLLFSIMVIVIYSDSKIRRTKINKLYNILIYKSPSSLLFCC